MLNWITAGESHGQALTAVIDGVPAGLELSSQDLQAALARRRLGHGRGARQAFERDELRLLGGVRHGRTMGGPVAVEIGNSEWPKWQTVMSADPVPPESLLVDAGTGDEREVARNRPLTRPRPGHADLPGMLKYDLDDARPVLERASARETASRVALGAVAEAILRQIAGVELVSHVLRIGGVELPIDTELPLAQDTARLDADPVRCTDPAISALMVAEIDAARKDGDTLGGIVEVIAYGVPVGLGSHTSAARRLDARLAAAVMSIQSVKGVELGDGFSSASRRGSAAHDEILQVTGGKVTRVTNRAGGVEGGISNGSPLRVRAAFKPISTVPRALRTIDLRTGEEASALHQRSDVCAVVPGAVVAQAEVALVLAHALLEKTGGDSVAEARRNLKSYLARIEERTSW
ncbi:Chorismate synthase [Actinomyces bovis]|uniref:Chorismate synthase n=1 Tax=Actinomyces bovis TaxID=1658 RepID=A0ABY1VSP8_9ACTO|nr:chorismate synthase [Actinomyces bovis]SPT54058.1 Chorismate synthase [Actinomyces bovis]VEG53762.1 Chorismate synthase [Actinomyces israelii]